MKQEYQRGRIGDLVHFIAESYKLDEAYLRAQLVTNFPELKDRSKCANCGESMQAYWHDISPGLVSGLIKAVQFVKKTNKNEFHLSRDLDLSKVEYNNFQKLRFHALVTKIKERGGYWLITRRGGEFLRGEISIPFRVQTFRNRVIEHSEELIHIKEFKNKFPSFQNEFLTDLEQGRLL